MKKIFLGIFFSLIIFNALVVGILILSTFQEKKVINTIINVDQSLNASEKPMFFEGTVYKSALHHGELRNNEGVIRIMILGSDELLGTFTISNPSFPHRFKLDLRTMDVLPTKDTPVTVKAIHISQANAPISETNPIYSYSVFEEARFSQKQGINATDLFLLPASPKQSFGICKPIKFSGTVRLASNADYSNRDVYIVPKIARFSNYEDLVPIQLNFHSGVATYEKQSINKRGSSIEYADGPPDGLFICPKGAAVAACIRPENRIYGRLIPASPGERCATTERKFFLLGEKSDKKSFYSQEILGATISRH